MFLVTVDQEATGKGIVIVTAGDQTGDQVAGAADMTTGVLEEAVVAADAAIEESSRFLGLLDLLDKFVLFFNHFHILANISQ